MMPRYILLLVAMLSWGFVPLNAAAPDQDGQAFRQLFGQWKKAQERERKTSAVPTARSAPAVPSRKRMTSGVGIRTDPILHRPRYHAGVDLPEPTGAPIYATANGRVGAAGWVNGYGLLVTIHHPSGYETRYAHMSRITVAKDAIVRRGRLIGYVGSTGRSTGPHLHYEIRLRGRVIDPKGFM